MRDCYLSKGARENVNLDKGTTFFGLCKFMGGEVLIDWDSCRVRFNTFLWIDNPLGITKR